MTERELLEFAAKSINKDGTFQMINDGHNPVYKGIAPLGSDSCKWWNPLQYNDDALELAIELGVSIEFGSNLSTCASLRLANGNQIDVEQDWNIPEWGSYGKYKATRLAIVRAAALMYKISNTGNTQ